MLSILFEQHFLKRNKDDYNCQFILMLFQLFRLYKVKE